MANLLRVMLVAQLFFCLRFLTGMIQSHQRFLIPAIAPLAYNRNNTGYNISLALFGIYAPAVGMVLGADYMLVQLPAAISLGFKPTFNFDFRLPGVREVLKLMPPRALAGIDQVEQFVAVILSSLWQPDPCLFNVARLLYAVPTLLFGATIGQQLCQPFRYWSRPRIGIILENSIRRLSSGNFFGPTCLYIVYSLAYSYCQASIWCQTFPWEATLLTGKTLAILMVSAGFYAIMQLIIRAFMPFMIPRLHCLWVWELQYLILYLGYWQ